MKETKTAILSGINPDKSKIIAPNTVEYFIKNIRYIRFHHTDILIFHPNIISINSGGWKTRSTKNRINAYLPVGYNLQSERNFWILFTPDNRIPYRDHMIINLNSKNKTNYPIALKQYRKEQKSITDFINRYAKKLLSGTMQKPDAGDCWICQFAIQNPEKKDAGHLHSHIKEKYLVPSLIWLACKATGNDYFLYYVNKLQSGDILNNSLDSRTIKRIFRSYFRKQVMNLTMIPKKRFFTCLM
jgi:hypothetical protein